MYISRQLHVLYADELTIVLRDVHPVLTVICGQCMLLLLSRKCA